ncbi:MAG: ROK family protein [Clostridia bacterium]|nr:ROK family protein [Clostridia bacterium]
MRDGKIGKRVTVPTDARHGLDGIRATIESGVAAFRQDAYSAVGFSTAGDVDAATGSIVYATDNLPGYTGFALSAFVERLTGKPCRALNDGAGRAAGRTVRVRRYGGDGVAVDDRHRYRRRVCRKRRCRAARSTVCRRQAVYLRSAGGGIEVYASGTALSASVAEHRLPVRGADIWPLYAAADPNARQAVYAWLDGLAAGIEKLYAVKPFDRLIVGGGVSDSAAFWLPALQKRLDLPVTAAKLRGDAGIIGAYYHAVEAERQ